MVADMVGFRELPELVNHGSAVLQQRLLVQGDSHILTPALRLCTDGQNAT